MTTRKRQTGGESQRMIDFPPQASAIQLQIWQRCKLKYAERIILLSQNGYYYTYGQDANIVAAMTGVGLECIEDSTFCQFPGALLEQALAALSQADRFWVICEPPEDPSLHIFN